MTAKTESVQYDHPNHTVTVTTVSDLDLSGARLLGLPLPEVGPRTALEKKGFGSRWVCGGCSELVRAGPYQESRTGSVLLQLSYAAQLIS